MLEIIDDELELLRQENVRLKKELAEWKNRPFEAVHTQTEENFFRGQELFRQIINFSDANIYVKDVDGRYLLVNRRIEDIFHLCQADIIGKTDAELFPNSPEALRAEWRANDLAVLNSEAPIQKEERLVQEDGEHIVLSTKFPLRDSTGKIYAVCGISSDITERKHAEEIIHRREQEFRALVENSPDIIARFDRDLRQIYVNQAIERATGVSPLEIVGKTNLELGTPEDVAIAWNEKISYVFETGQETLFEFNWPARDGNGLQYYQARFVPECAPDGTVATVLSIATDITKHKLDEQELYQREQEFRALVENSPDIIARFDRNLRQLYVNPVVEQALGMKPAEIVGKMNHELGVATDLRQLWDAKILEVFETGQATTLEFELAAPDNSGLKYYHAHIVPEFSRDGSIKTVLGITRNITEQKRAEELKTFFMSLAGHELRTPLTSIKGYAQMLQRQIQRVAPENREALARNADKIIFQSNRMNDLIKQLLDFSSIQNHKFELKYDAAQDVNALVLRIVEQHRFANLTHQLLVELPNSPCLVELDTARIEQVLDNLINNAVKYSEPGTNITVGIRSKASEVVFWVKDEGLGISPEDQARIFTRFYRIKSEATHKVDGLGLGLYITSEVVRQHGGRIWVESEPGLGSTFSFSLPTSKLPEA